MPNLPLLFVLPALTVIGLLLAGLLLHKRLFWVHAGLAGVLVLAGCAGVMAYEDYRWAAAARSSLPADALLLNQTRAAIPGRPWTHRFPPVTRLTAIHNVATVIEAHDSLLLEFDWLERERGAAERTRRTLLNCTSQDLVLPGDGHIRIETLPAGDPLIRLLCQPG